MFPGGDHMKRKFPPAVLLPFGLYTGLPLIFFLLGNHPNRAVILEGVSMAVLLAFCLAMGQFYWSRTNSVSRKKVNMNQIRHTHEMLGYVSVVILALHPFLLVMPRFFSNGVKPLEALTAIVTTTSSLGVVLGMVAWVVLVVLGMTSMLRGKLPWGYQLWRKIHGALAMVFLLSGVGHAIDLGRHVHAPMAMLLLFLAVSGVVLWLVSTFSSLYVSSTALQRSQQQ